jgi:hypothetical protein
MIGGLMGFGGKKKDDNYEAESGLGLNNAVF